MQTINDGYTLPGTLPAASAAHPQVEFRFRVALPEERQAFFDWESWLDKRQEAQWNMQASGEKVEKPLDPGGKAKRKTEIIVAHVQIEGVKPTADFIRKLHPNQFDRLFAVVLGLMPADDEKKPDEGDDAKN